MKKRISSALMCGGGILLTASVLCGCSKLENVTVWEHEDVIVKTGGIYIPDTNFKSYLTGNFDTDGDGEISEEEALAATEIDISGNSVSRLTGIEYFSNLERFDCSNNCLTAIDLSQNTRLRELNASSNDLISIDLAKNMLLRWLDISNNKEISILDLSNNKELTHLYVMGLGISELDLTNNSRLERIDYRDTPNLKRVVNGGVVIDGLTWALHNVGALYPEECGNTYTWNQAQSACPEGWRVPTRDELKSLSAHYRITDSLDGCWFSGSHVYSESSPAIFFFSCNNAFCWSSQSYCYDPEEGWLALCLAFLTVNVGVGHAPASIKCPVRCLKN